MATATNNKADYSRIIDLAFKALLGLLTWLVQEIYSDVKQIREQMPAMRVEIDNLKDRDLQQRDRELMQRFKKLRTTYYMKEEPTITYDSLIKPQI